MYVSYSPPKLSLYGIWLLSLGVLLLGSCGRVHQPGMEDDPQEILNTKLNNPRVALTPNQSISLIEYATQLGEENAASATGKEVVLVLGNTGVGKSTAVNYLMGCEMKLVEPSELGLKGPKEVVIVNAEGTRPEVMPIGHGRQSRTFMPQIVLDADDSNQAYCDCPGFSDNRGAEINLANAINTRRVLQQATGVKAVFLVSYYGLHDDRGAGVMASCWLSIHERIHRTACMRRPPGYWLSRASGLRPYLLSRHPAGGARWLDSGHLSARRVSGAGQPARHRK